MLDSVWITVRRRQRSISPSLPCECHQEVSLFHICLQVCAWALFEQVSLDRVCLHIRFCLLLYVANTVRVLYSSSFNFFLLYLLILLLPCMIRFILLLNTFVYPVTELDLPPLALDYNNHVVPYMFAIWSVRGYIWIFIYISIYCIIISIYCASTLLPFTQTTV